MGRGEDALGEGGAGVSDTQRFWSPCAARQGWRARRRVALVAELRPDQELTCGSASARAPPHCRTRASMAQGSEVEGGVGAAASTWKPCARLRCFIMWLNVFRRPGIDVRWRVEKPGNVSLGGKAAEPLGQAWGEGLAPLARCSGRPDGGNKGRADPSLPGARSPPSLVEGRPGCDKEPCLWPVLPSRSLGARLDSSHRPTPRTAGPQRGEGRGSAAPAYAACSARGVLGLRLPGNRRVRRRRGDEQYRCTAGTRLADRARAGGRRACGHADPAPGRAVAPDGRGRECSRVWGAGRTQSLGARVQGAAAPQRLCPAARRQVGLGASRLPGPEMDRGTRGHPPSEDQVSCPRAPGEGGGGGG